MVLCLDRPGQAVIDSVEPENGYGGLRIDAFVAVPNPHQTGGDPFGAADASIVQLSQADSEPDHLTYTPPGTVVDHQCQPEGAIVSPSTASYLLYVQYSKPADVTAGETGLVIHYTPDGQHLTMSAPVFNIPVRVARQRLPVLRALRSGSDPHGWPDRAEPGQAHAVAALTVGWMGPVEGCPTRMRGWGCGHDSAR